MAIVDDIRVRQNFSPSGYVFEKGLEDDKFEGTVLIISLNTLAKYCKQDILIENRFLSWYFCEVSATPFVHDESVHTPRPEVL